MAALVLRRSAGHAQSASMSERLSQPRTGTICSSDKAGMRPALRRMRQVGMMWRAAMMSHVINIHISARPNLRLYLDTNI